jgi:hypothetical protein
MCSYELIRRDPLPVLRAIERFGGMPSHFEAGNFDNVRVNASDQRNIVWLNRLMHSKWFADLVVRLVPKWVILRARYWVQTRRHSDAPSGGSPGNEQDLALAEDRFAEDRRYIEDLFRESGLMLGNGEPFQSSAVAST